MKRMLIEETNTRIIAVRVGMPDTNSSSGVIIVCASVNRENLPVISADGKRFLKVHVLHPDAMRGARVDRESIWQGWHLSMNISWLFGKALHGQLLPREFTYPVTARNAAQRYELLADYLGRDIEQERIPAVELMKNHEPKTRDLTIYKAHHKFLGLVVETVQEELGLLPAIWVDEAHTREDSLRYPIYDMWCDSYSIPVPPGMVGIVFLDDETEGTSIRIYDSEVSIQEPLNLPYAVKGSYDHKVFARNIIGGYWMPQEIAFYRSASVSHVPLYTKGCLVVFTAADENSLMQLFESRLPSLVGEFLEDVVLFVPTEKEWGEEEEEETGKANALLARVWNVLSRTVVGVSGNEPLKINQAGDRQYRLVLRFRQGKHSVFHRP